MTDLSNWAFPPALQPNPKELSFDLNPVLDSVLRVRAEVPPDAFTAETLGLERVGSGVVIGEDGLVLTIGYLITEAQSLWLTTNQGVVLPGYPLAYDQASGLGLIMPLGRLRVTPLARGSAALTGVGDEVLMVGHGGRAHALKAKVISKREFAGYWEYLLEEALFSAPAHPQWGGAALVGESGELLGVGSLLVQEAVGQGEVEGNMTVPIDQLEPILDSMLKTGRAPGPARPWLGLYATQSDGHLVVSGLARKGPADRAGVRIGDLVVEVAEHPVATLPDLYRAIWALGPAGTEVPLTLLRDRTRISLRVHSMDRSDLLKKPSLH
jgi:S1-C subfamily serine protease